MLNRLIIIGAGGCGKVMADTALKMGYRNVAFADDGEVKERMGFPVVCAIKDVIKLNDGKTDFVIAIGNNEIRKKIVEENDVHYVSIVHPSAIIGRNVKIGQGTVVMAGAIINPCTEIGKHCIINTKAVVEHDNVIEDYAHVSPNAVLGGTVRIGIATHVGIGATVKNNVKICSNCIVGAGAVVLKNIGEAGVYYGVPAVKRE